MFVDEDRIVGSKRGSRDFRDGEGSKISRWRETACREDWMVGACLEEREGLGRSVLFVVARVSLVGCS